MNSQTVYVPLSATQAQLVVLAIRDDGSCSIAVQRPASADEITAYSGNAAPDIAVSL